MAALMASRGYIYSDTTPGNLGRLSGELIIVDPGALREAVSPQ
jgi:hypothetical protein